MKRLIVVLAALAFVSCAQIKTIVKSYEKRAAECDLDPTHCSLCEKGWTWRHEMCHAPPPPPVTPQPTPVTYCDRDHACSCWTCIDAPQDRIGLSAAQPCVHPVYVACPTPRPSEPTATPTAGPTATPSATAAPSATATPAPTPEPAAVDAWCVDFKAIPSAPVPIFVPGRACRPRDGMMDIVAPDGVAGCIRNWKCADGNQAFQPGPRAQQSLTNGGPGGVHRCGLGEGPGSAYLCDAGRRPSEGWHRQMEADGSIHQPGAEPDGYVPYPWESNAACRPVPCSSAAPTPTPAARPVPGATPTPSAAGSCSLPPGAGDGVDCPRTSPRYLADVDAAITRVVTSRPDWFDASGGIVVDGRENDVRRAVVGELQAAGACAFFDGEEIAVKRENGFSEQYHVLSSARHVRRGEGSYRATCTPAWSAIPAAPEPTPAPEPLASCPCVVAVTVAFLGINDGPAPVLRAGDSITLDSTYRLARSEGDGRGAASERVEGRRCTPERGPDWDWAVPGGVNVRQVNGGYGLRLENLQPGTYTASVRVPGQLVDGETPPGAMSACSWPAGPTVRSSIGFEVR